MVTLNKECFALKHLDCRGMPGRQVKTRSTMRKEMTAQRACRMRKMGDLPFQCAPQISHFGINPKATLLRGRTFSGNNLVKLLPS